MTQPRRLLVLPLALLVGVALAGSWFDGDPGLHAPRGAQQLSSLSASVRPVLQLGGRPPARPAARVCGDALSGPVFAVHAIDRDGLETELEIPPGLDLSDPLPVSDGAVELLIELDGPVTVTRAGQIPRVIVLPTLQVFLEDPDDASERGAVTLLLSGEPEDGVVGLGAR